MEHVFYLADFVEMPLEVKVKELWYHKRNLMQTATGYGNKLTTEWMIKIEGRWHRVYCRIFSNIGSPYIIWRKREYIIKYDHHFGGK
jgi:hypothetical protein